MIQKIKIYIKIINTKLVFMLKRCLHINYKRVFAKIKSSKLIEKCKIINSRRLPKLPLIIIMGANNSGKTVLLKRMCGDNVVNCKINNIDWIITEKALLIEIGEKMPMELLAELKKQRHRIIKSSIILTIEIDKITLNGFRELILKLNNCIGYFIPVNIIITKAAKVEGYFTYFNNDINLPIANPNNANKELAKNILELHQAINQKRVITLAEANDIKTKFNLYNFPEKFAVLTEEIKKNVKLLTASDLAGKIIPFSGLYFVDQHSDPTSTQNIWQQILTDTITSTPQLISSPYYYALLSKGVKILSFITLLFISISFWHAYRVNQQWITKADGLVHDIQQSLKLTNKHIVHKMRVLHDLFEYRQKLANYPDYLAWHDRLGLFYANHLLVVINKILLIDLSYLFKEPVQQALKNDISDLRLCWQKLDDLGRSKIRGKYVAMLVDFMLLHTKEALNLNHNINRYNEIWIKTLNEMIMQNNAYIDSIPWKNTLPMIKFYFATLKQRSSDPIPTKIIDQQVGSINSALNQYALLKYQGEKHFGKLKINNILNSNFNLSKIYTKKLFKNYVKPEVNVLPYDIHHQVLQLYVNDYVNKWIKFVNTIKLSPIVNYSQAEHILMQITQQNSPLFNLIATLKSNLTIPLLKKQKLVAELTALRKSEAGKAYRQSLQNLQKTIEYMQLNVSQTVNIADITKVLEHNIMASHDLLKNISDHKVQQSLYHLFIQPARETWRFILSIALNSLTKDWQKNIYKIYQDRIANKFPFANSNEDVSIIDIQQFFQPKLGVFWQFYNRYVATLKDHKILGLNEHLSQQFAQQLIIINNITQLFYSADQQGLSLSFKIYPIPSPKVSEVTLQINDIIYHYNNGPQEWHRITFHGNNDELESRLIIMTANDGQRLSIATTGVWSFLRLLNKATIHKINHSEYKITWHFHSANDNNYAVNFYLKMSTEGDFIKNLLHSHLNLPYTIK